MYPYSTSKNLEVFLVFLREIYLGLSGNWHINAFSIRELNVSNSNKMEILWNHEKSELATQEVLIKERIKQVKEILRTSKEEVPKAGPFSNFFTLEEGPILGYVVFQVKILKRSNPLDMKVLYSDLQPVKRYSHTNCGPKKS